MSSDLYAAAAASSGEYLLVAGIDIGGTKIAVLVTGEDGAVLARGVVPAPAQDGGAAMADAAATLTRDLVAHLGGTLRAAGVGAAGVVDPVSGTILAASAMFTDWVGFALADALAERLGVPVAVENDVNAFLLGEVAAGAGHGDDVLGVMLGTGVGGALVIDGALRHGPNGAAGEIGHTPGYSDLVCTCGQTGHLETLASGTSIALRYGERSGAHGLGAAEVAQRARAGDADAIAVFQDAGRAVALACASAATLVDLDVAVIGGGVSHAWDLLEPTIIATLQTDAPVSGAPLRIIPAALGSDAVALGAAAAARSRTPSLLETAPPVGSRPTP
ncbi:ROK family protein [Microbacterium nymphoidis]|uniref:ROK family protein n=1 Tax=Microbacterium nymphoidis TaxID=2898586 RepID=UPI001E389FE8|nr:ROK family protein [Microbacterium nymphoidis]MCD2497049.1 ROK family protein [Microbacterium nymphoidis]